MGMAHIISEVSSFVAIKALCHDLTPPLQYKNRPVQAATTNIITDMHAGCKHFLFFLCMFITGSSGEKFLSGMLNKRHNSDILEVNVKENG